MSAQQTSQKNGANQSEKRTPRVSPSELGETPASGSIHVTIFRGAKDPEPDGTIDAPWPALLREFDGALNTEAAYKKELFAFGPYRLRDGSARGDANVVERTLIALDSDKGADPEAFVERLRGLGLAGYVYTTPGDTPDLRK
jgi:hypothetical protein